MKKTILLMLLSIISILSYSQTSGKGKVYLKNGEVKEGKMSIDTRSTRVGLMGINVGIKGKNRLKQVSIKEKGSKKEKIGIDEIEKIEFDQSTKKQTKFITYVPITVSEEQILCREIAPNKLYGVYKMQSVTIGSLEGGEYEAYYIKKGNKYEKTTLAAIKKEYNCSMDEGKGREEKIAKCLQGK